MGNSIHSNIEDYRDPDWPKGLYRRGDSYRFSRNLRGRRFFDVFGPVSHDEAVRRVTRYNFDISDGKEPTTKKAKRTSTFAHFAYNVWLPRKKMDIQPSSYCRYRAVIDNFSYYLANVLGIRSASLADITAEAAGQYIVHRSNTPLMPNGSRKFTRALKTGASKVTLHFEKETLKQVLRAAVELKLIDENPFGAVKTSKPTRKEMAAKHRPLSKDEAAALMLAATVVDECGEIGNARFADVVEFLLKTGERLNEMTFMEWSDVNWDDGLIRVAEKQVTEVRTIALPTRAVERVKAMIAGRTREERLFETEKDIADFGVCLGIRKKDALLAIEVGDVDLEKRVIATSRTFGWHPKGTAGEIPMSNDIRHLLHRLQMRRTSNFVFAHHDGGRCRLDVLDLLKKAQKLAGIKGRLRVHDLRHTCAVRLRENGIPLETIMGILRHADIRETLIYAPYHTDEGKKAVMCLDTPESATQPAEGKIREILARKQGQNEGIRRAS